jgi:hypothetical protein
MTERILYRDNFVELTDSDIAFHRYYFLWDTKRIELSAVERLRICRYGRRCNVWRIQGSGDFKTWFPCDWRRPWRDTVYILTRRNERWEIGFTVQNPKEFEKALETIGMQITEHEKPYTYVGILS